MSPIQEMIEHIKIGKKKSVIEKNIKSYNGKWFGHFTNECRINHVPRGGCNVENDPHMDYGELTRNQTLSFLWKQQMMNLEE